MTLTYRYHRPRWSRRIDEIDFASRASEACVEALLDAKLVDEDVEVVVEVVGKKAQAGLDPLVHEDAPGECETCCDEIYDEMLEEE